MLYTSGDENQNSEDKNSKNETNNFSNWLFKHPNLCLIIFVLFSLLFVLLLNSIWYWLEQIWDGPKSSLTFSEGFQLAIDVIFMCIIAYFQYTIEKRWKKETEMRETQDKIQNELLMKQDKKNHEERLKLDAVRHKQELISERIRSLIITNEIKAVGCLKSHGYIQHYPKSEESLLYSKHDLVFSLSSKTGQTIIPPFFEVSGKIFSCSIKIFQINGSDLEIQNIPVTSFSEMYKNGKFFVFFDEVSLLDDEKKALFNFLANVLFLNQKGRTPPTLCLEMELELTDNSLNIYNNISDAKQGLTFNLDVTIELVPINGVTETGEFELEMFYTNIKVS